MAGAEFFLRPERVASTETFFIALCSLLFCIADSRVLILTLTLTSLLYLATSLKVDVIYYLISRRDALGL